MNKLRRARYWLKDQWLQFPVRLRRNQWGRRIFSTGDHKRRHDLLSLLADKKDDGPDAPTSWEHGVEVTEVANHFRWHGDREAWDQLSVLIQDGCVEVQEHPEMAGAWWVITPLGRTALRKGVYLREGTQENIGTLTFTIAVVSALLTIWQMVSMSQLEDRVRRLEGIPPTRSQQAPPANTGALDLSPSDTPSGPAKMVVRYCGVCAAGGPCGYYAASLRYGLRVPVASFSSVFRVSIGMACFVRYTIPIQVVISRLSLPSR